MLSRIMSFPRIIRDSRLGGTLCNLVGRWGDDCWFSNPRRPPRVPYGSAATSPAWFGSRRREHTPMARELQRLVKRPKFGEITSLAWSEYQQWYSIGWKRKNIRNPFTLLLPEDLRGRLELAEWKILPRLLFPSPQTPAANRPKILLVRHWRNHADSPWRDSG